MRFSRGIERALLAESRHLDVGAASRPIAGKRGSHRYNASLRAGDTHVGAGLPAMRQALAQRFEQVSVLGRKWTLSPGLAGHNTSCLFVLQQFQGAVEIKQCDLLGNLSQSRGQAWFERQPAQFLERAHRTRIAFAQ